ncbi:MAG: hypothetical protein V3U13_11515 [Gemmatimonadota bacterium]
MRFLALAILALGTQNGSQSPGAIEVEAVLESDSVRIGEVFTFSVTIAGVLENARVSFPQFPDSGPVTGLGPALLPRDAGGGVRSARYQLVAWNVGDLLLPAGDIRVVSELAELRVPLPQRSIHVASVLPEDADADTLAWQPPADVVGGNWSLSEKLAAAGLVLLALLAMLLYVRRHGSTSAVPVPSGTPARERALAALDRLQEGGLAEAGEVKGFYSALSQIVREFLAGSEERWRLDLTTPELVAAVGGGGVDPSEVVLLGELLVEADLVKFARRRPSPEEEADSLESVRRWIAEFELPVEEAAVWEEDDWAEGAVTVLEELFAGVEQSDPDESLRTHDV